MRKIVVAACVHQEPKVFRAYIKRLAQLDLPPDHELKAAFILDPSCEHAADLRTLALSSHDLDVTLLDAPEKPEEAVYEVGNTTHHWNTETFSWLGLAKNRLIEHALEERATHIFFVDSDLLLAKDTLTSLHACDVQIVNGVFWTSWVEGQVPMPQVWLKQPYTLHGMGLTQEEFLTHLINRQLLPVIGGGACVLIHTDALRLGLNYDPVPNPPPGPMSQGEDRHFAEQAKTLRIPQYADAWPDIIHLYHPFQRTDEYIEEAFDWLDDARIADDGPGFSDLVSFRVEPLEDPKLRSTIGTHFPTAFAVRGRFGALDLAPEVESALAFLRPGEHRILNIHFPNSHPIEPYRGHKKAVKLTLHSAKPFEYPPIIGDYLTRGLHT